MKRMRPNERLVLTVTEEDKARAAQARAEDKKPGTSCPLYQAARRKFPTAYLRAGAWYLYVDNRCYEYSPRCIAFVRAWDAGVDPAPGTFCLAREY